MEGVETQDYFTHTPSSQTPKHGFRPPNTSRPSVSFQSPGLPQQARPHPMSRMSTHRVDHSSTNFAEVLHDDGGSHGLERLDVDYFNTVLDVFKDRKQHHSPVVFDFMLLHEINIHHLEHLLIAEWDWLTVALSSEQPGDREHLAEKAPQRLNEIRSLLHDYSVALKDFEEMRNRATLDERSDEPLTHSSWHERMMHVHDQQSKAQQPLPSAIRRLSNAIMSSMQSSDPEKITRRTTDPLTPSGHRRQLFGADNPACRQLAGVEDWTREYKKRELNEEQKKAVERDEWLATRFKRFSLAFFAGISLIGPMLLMTLVSSLRCSLSTTSVATLLFALSITYFTHVGERDIVVITAAYAAVLVVL